MVGMKNKHVYAAHMDIKRITAQRYDGRRIHLEGGQNTQSIETCYASQDRLTLELKQSFNVLNIPLFKKIRFLIKCLSSFLTSACTCVKKKRLCH